MSESVRRSRRGGGRKGDDGEAVKRTTWDGTSAFAVFGLLKIVAFLALFFVLYFFLVLFLACIPDCLVSCCARKPFPCFYSFSHAKVFACTCM